MHLINLLLIFFVFSTSHVFAEGTPTLPKAPYVPGQTVRQWQNERKNVQFIDVREPNEYAAGHLEKAVNIPYHQIEQRASEISKDKDVLKVIYCTYSVWRAPYAANALADIGFDGVYVLEGGASAWNAGGQVIYAMDPQKKPKVIAYDKSLPMIFTHPADTAYKEKIDLTIEELARYDGKDGRPAYVAVNGIIYDLTQSRLWRGGEHDPSKGHAVAGRDLTDVLKDSPHGDKHLKDFPVVGRVVKKN